MCRSESWSSAKAAPGFLLECDDLAHALQGVDGEGAELAGGFPGLGAETIDALAHQEGTEAHRDQERQQSEGQPRARPGQHREHGGRHQNRDEGRGHGVGKEIFDELYVMRRQRHEFAGAPPREIGRRQGVELAEDGDAHLGQQPECHLMGDPGFQPMQRAGKRRQDRQRNQ